jgi:DNA-binding MarR family transcriptional regulator
MKAGWLSKDSICNRQAALTQEIEHMEAVKLTHDEQIELDHRRDLVAITDLQLEIIERKKSN